ncbi:peptide-methionine (S)-S-oxide reductase MsrA [Paucibacter sp. R3-3]|uniref:Peptide methionine sulfoxide reductase MsrA n=2 Tax=Roseateles agri TaxID=3098619 RepID=A0ABU5DET2_9BURK|nr:peptide-methionine (S)-S-oxide reductase MsrA [Paucibacter sp. R3-3]MDY0744654.1 peptide-methionine (S)-S-oxide reductase MsrA [Paucibacter sp. R3-3]
MNRTGSSSSSVLSRRQGLTWLAGGVALVVAGLSWQGSSGVASAAEAAVTLPPPAQDAPPAAQQGLQKIVFAGGCFWGVQGVFQHVKGVTRAVSGYAGGPASKASYEIVSSGSTGHAESVEVTFDPSQVRLGTLLQIYFSVVHDPTQLNRQGPDSGTQYRSAIFTNDAAQRQVAQAYIAQLDAAKVFPKPIVTKIEANGGFYPAEAYHQDFLTENPRYPYIVYNDLPKIDNLKKMFPQAYRVEPVLVKRPA